jgi:hypothetical protein
MRGTAVLVTFVTVASAALLTGCGGGEGSATRATLSEDGCTYEGTTTPSAGVLTIDVENETAYFGAFALASLADGSTIESLAPVLEAAARQFADSGTLPELPPFYEQVVRTGIEGGTTGKLPGDLSAGTYALMCFVDDLPTWRAYAAAQLDVSP